MPTGATATWQYLGIVVAAQLSAFGVWAVWAPHSEAGIIFRLRPPSNSPLYLVNRDDVDLSVDDESTRPPPTDPSDPIAILMPLVGLCDLGLAFSMFIFAYQNKYAEVGTVILSALFMQIWEVPVVYTRRGAPL